jgi:hypothetical protein
VCTHTVKTDGILAFGTRIQLLWRLETSGTVLSITKVLSWESQHVYVHTLLDVVPFQEKEVQWIEFGVPHFLNNLWSNPGGLWERITTQ